MGLDVAQNFPAVLVEAMAYVLAALAAYVQGRMLLLPQRHGFDNRWQAYLGGLRATAQLYMLVILILLIGAVYEAFELVHLAPWIVRWAERF